MRILICGVTGMIGHQMWRQFARDFELYGTLHARRGAAPRPEMFAQRTIEDFEAADPKRVTQVLDEVKPAVILNCVGITKRKPEGNDVEPCFAVNSLFPHVLARWAANHGARVIHYSTDCVFDGATGNYVERSVVTAPDVYGRTKYFGELDYEHCLTIRTSMIGRELASHTELLDWFLAQRGKRIKGFRHAMYSGMTTLAMADLLRKIIVDFPRLNGRHQIAGPVISKYDLLCLLRDAFKLDVEITPAEEFRCDRTLNSAKFTAATGLATPSWPQMVDVLAADRAFYENR